MGLPGRFLEAADQGGRGQQPGEEEEEERRFVLRTFTVFNADQVEGAEAFQVHGDGGQTHAQPDFQPAEDLIAATHADIRYGGNRAYYVAHCRGHISKPREATSSCCRPRRRSTRRGRSTKPPCMSWGTGLRSALVGLRQQGYALGELAAEIASCYVSTELGIPQGEGLGNHAAYLKNWLEA